MTTRPMPVSTFTRAVNSTGSVSGLPAGVNSRSKAGKRPFVRVSTGITTSVMKLGANTTSKSPPRMVSRSESMWTTTRSSCGPVFRIRMRTEDSRPVTVKLNGSGGTTSSRMD